MLKDQRGVGGVAVIILVVLALALGFAGAYFWQQQMLVNAQGDLQQQLATKEGTNQLLEQRVDELEGQLQETRGKLNSPTGGYELVSQECKDLVCLFNKNESDHPVGTGSLVGFHTEYEDVAFGETETCDSLVVTGGTDSLIQSFVRLFESGNTIHDLDEEGRPIVNLDLSELSTAERRLITNSDADEPVEIIVFQPQVNGVGAGTCFSAFKIVEVRELE